jgi:hypothetical protein
LVDAFYGGNVKYAVKFPALMALAIAAFASLLVVGCKSAPDLSKADALSMIQAYYAAQPATGLNITVNSDGMVQGATAKYWNRTKVYPNRYWADFTLTPDGKKIIKLADGSDTIKWRPESPTDDNFTVVVTTVTANHPKARDLADIQSVGSKTRTVTFTEAVDFTGIPQPLQGIAHNPGNKLTDSKTADFTLDSGAWKLQSIQ